MKAKYVLLIITIATSLSLSSQTTQEEYDYLVNDYVSKRNDKGFELKKGYVIENLFFNDADTTSITIQKFVKVEGENKKAVAYLLGYKKNKKPTEFTIIPHPKSDGTVNAKFWNSLYHSGYVSGEKHQYIVSTMARYLIW